MKSHRKSPVCVIISLAVLIFVALLSSCGETGHTGPTSPEHFALISVSDPGSSRSQLGRVFNADLPVAVGHIYSGTPDYLKFTLYKIVLEGSFDGGGGVAPIWEDTDGTEITISGSGAIDLTGVADIGELPVGTVTGVKITLDTRAKVVGSLYVTLVDPTDMTKTVSGTVYTKTAWSYDAHDYTGGTADWHNYETAPAEETIVWFNGPDNNGELTHEFWFPADETLVAGDTRPFTLLIDISRALRFYDGLSDQGPASPSDSASTAYFFSHGVLTGSIACFFGLPGQVQGYSTLYENSSANATNVVPGWMTLVFDSAGKLQSGILMPDDDGGVIAKGLIVPMDVDGSVTTIDFSYRNGLTTNYYQVDTTGFMMQSVLGSSSDVLWTKTPYLDSVAGTAESGFARYSLKLDFTP